MFRVAGGFEADLGPQCPVLSCVMVLDLFLFFIFVFLFFLFGIFVFFIESSALEEFRCGLCDPREDLGTFCDGF